MKTLIHEFSFLLLLSGIFALVQFTACSPSSDLTILNSSLTAREFTDSANVKQSMVAVTGQAKNVNDSTIQGCEIRVIFYDNQKNIIGGSQATKESLTAGEVWNFTVQLTNADAWKARSYDISSSNK